MQFKIPKFGFKSKKRGNAAGFFGAKLSFISNHLSIISNKLSQNNHLSIINDKLSKKRINYKLSIFGKKIFINYKLLIAVGVLALAGVGGTLALNGFFGGGAAIPEDTMTRGLVGYWSFDEGGGTVARDASGNNNHGTLTNGPKWTQGKNGTALQFDGKNDYVDCGNDASLDITDEITIETWVKPETDSVSYIVSKEILEGGTTWYGYRLDQYTGNTVRAHIWTDGDQGRNLSGAIFLNFWNHIVVTYSKNEEITKLYVNGILKDDDYTTGNIKIASSINFNIGRSNLSYPFDGLIDEVRIYNRALTEAEVKYHYNRGGPVAQWDMDEGSGSAINDKSGNGNDGTISGATWAQGKHGSALSFDGVNDYVNCGNKSVFNLTGAMTFAAWVVPGSGINEKTIVSKTGTTAAQTTFWMDIRKSNSWIYFGGYTSGGVAAYTTVNYNFTPGVWYYVAGTDDGTNLSIYVNGIKIKTATSQTRVSGSWNVEIGRRGSTLLQGWDGAIDDARIYNYARTEEEIRLDYNAGLATHLGPSGKTCSEDPAGCMDFGLAGHWDMDEGSGSILNDKSGNNNHGTLTNGPQWTQGKNGNALQFDGKDDYVDCGSTSSLNGISGVVSVEAWARLDKLKYNSIVNKRTNNIEGHWDFRHSLNYGLQFVNFDSGGNPKIINAAATFDNNWHHLVAVATDSEVKIYMDGKRLATTGTLAPIVSTSTNVKIGGWGLTGNYYLNGDIDDVKIYNRALSAEEVRYHYNQGKPVAQWDMDEGSGSAIKDKSGNGNNGTIFGATWAQGKHGTALSFDGVDDYATVANSASLNPTSKITVGLWAKRNGAGTGVTPGLLSKRANGFGLIWQVGADTERLSTRIYQSNGTAIDSGVIEGVLSVGTWRYINLVADGTNVITYVDGVPKKSVPYNGTILTGTALLTIGQQSNAYFNGQIDEVKIYDYARTEEEIRLDYNAGLATHLGPSGKTCSEDPAGCMDFGLAGHWDMDEGSGSILNDKSGNNNHGTLTNGPQWTQGKNGNALQFDGKDDYVSVAGITNKFSPYTISLWLDGKRGQQVGGLAISTGFSVQRWGLSLESGKISSVNTDGATTDRWMIEYYNLTNYPSGWHLITIVDDGTTRKFYRNGTYVGSYTNTIVNGGEVASFRIGRGGNVDASHFNGKIDGVKIYNRALSAEEVRYHYNHGGPVGYWAMDEGEGARAFDASGNNNTGVLANGPAWVEGKYGSALSFDGVDDYVGCGTDSSLNIADSMTASAWIYPKTLGEGSAGHIVGRGGTSGWCLYVYTGNSLKLYAGTIQAVSSANSITLNQWQYATVVYDKQNVRFFVNGVEKGVTAATSSIVNTGSCVIGARTTAGDFDFNGYLDEVKVYNYARTEEQIMQDYNAGVATHLK